MLEMNRIIESDNYRQPPTLGSIGERLSGLCNTQWDINGVWLLHKDLLYCLDLQGDQLPSAVHTNANYIVQSLSQTLDSLVFPSTEQTEHLLQLSSALQTYYKQLHAEPIIKPAISPNTQSAPQFESKPSTN